MIMRGSNSPRSKGMKTAASNDLAWKERRSLARKLFIQTAVWTALFVFSTTYSFGFSLSVSRRLANLPYVIWVNAFNNAQILLFCLIETAYFPEAYRSQDSEITTRYSSRIMQAFNRNGLAVFLVANLMTGLVNLTLKTLDMASLEAMAVLTVYAAVVTGVALFLDKTGLKIKL